MCRIKYLKDGFIEDEDNSIKCGTCKNYKTIEVLNGICTKENNARCMSIEYCYKYESKEK